MLNFLKNQIDKVTESTTETFGNYYNLAKITVNEKITKILSAIIVGVAIGVLILMIFFFLSVGGAIWVGQLLGDIKWGYFIFGGFFILLLLLFALFKKSIIRGIRNLIVTALYSQENNEPNGKN